MNNPTLPDHFSGPILTGYTQTLNDWEDREIDAINEPNRPIPSGAISKEQVIQQIWVRELPLFICRVIGMIRM